MRNPIQPSPDRPIPLPDCILMDAWWADRGERSRDIHGSGMRLVVGAREEGPTDRSDRGRSRG